jgi:hypothetical protein
MKDLIQKTKDFFAKIKTKKVSYERPGIKPTNDWRIILATAGLLILIVGGFSLYFYTQINSGQLFTVEDDTVEKEVKIDSQLLKTTIDDIQNREKSMANIKQNINIPSDPSL